MRRTGYAVMIAIGLQAVHAPPVEAYGISLPFAVSWPLVPENDRCTWKLSRLNGQSQVPEVPIPALRLGALVNQSTISFTAPNKADQLAWMSRQHAAGQPYGPIPFHVDSNERPWVAGDTPSQFMYLAYQVLPLLPYDNKIAPMAWVYALDVSKTTAQIASVEIDLLTAPKVTPRYRLMGGGPCQGETVDVYAPAASMITKSMIIDWEWCFEKTLPGCTKATPPRGRMLFVYKWPKRRFYIHRWVDFDAIAEVIGQASTRNAIAEVIARALMR